MKATPDRLKLLTYKAPMEIGLLLVEEGVVGVREEDAEDRVRWRRMICCGPEGKSQKEKKIQLECMIREKG